MKKFLQKQDYKYDKRGIPQFNVNELGDEVYLVDEHGNQIYPRKGKYLFAKNKWGEEYYAKSQEGNEIYPKRKRRSIYIQKGRDGDEKRHPKSKLKLARDISGRERYPKDDKNNEYYFVDPETNEALVLRDEKGEYYFARDKMGSVMIPTRFFYQYQKENRKSMEEYYVGVDFGKNIVYIEGMKPLNSNVFLTCLCQLIIGIPDVVCSILANLRL